MEKIVIRTTPVSGISSKIIQETDCEETLLEMAQTKGKEYVLKNIFDEKDLSYQQLNDEYNRFFQGENSSIFATMYIIDSKFGIVVDQNIYLYHYDLSFRKEQQDLFKWEYMDSKKYLGDSWWFEDDEILKDIQRLSILEFLEKYKGY